MDENFLISLALFNTSLGLANFTKNTEQQEHQKEIENKINKIMEMLLDIERGSSNGNDTEG